MYNITQTQMRDLYGKLLWPEPLLPAGEYRLYKVGEIHSHDWTEEEGVVKTVTYRVVRVAIAENTQHINLQPVVEEVVVSEEPHL
tara:strand:+ start:7410 stop:7664 length:255 start_codon:yes stop_codon:yes gene_type:complete